MTVEEFIEEWENDSPHVLVKTSGSTGKPKEMLVEKLRMRNSARITCDFLSLHKGDRALLCMSVDYIAGKMMVVRSLERGLKLTAVVPSNHPLREVDEEDMDLVAMVPSQVYETLKVEEERKRLMRVHNLIIGGGAISSELEEELRWWPNNVYSTYGMTETLSHVALRRLNGEKRSEWYEPFDSVNVSLDEEGRLVISAPLVCPELLTTNDIAELHEDGRRFKVLGRKDNVVCSGGIKMQIEELEEMLRPHMNMPYAISKRGDAKFGEAVVLVVEGVGSVGERESIALTCKSVLPKYSLPKDIVFMEKIPMTETQKINRKGVSEKLKDIAGAEAPKLK